MNTPRYPNFCWDVRIQEKTVSESLVLVRNFTAEREEIWQTPTTHGREMQKCCQGLRKILNSVFCQLESESIRPSCVSYLSGKSKKAYQWLLKNFDDYGPMYDHITLYMPP